MPANALCSPVTINFDGLRPPAVRSFFDGCAEPAMPPTQSTVINFGGRAENIRVWREVINLM